MKHLKLLLNEMVITGPRGDLKDTKDESDVNEIIISVDTGMKDCVNVYLDNNFNITHIQQLQSNTTEDEIVKLISDNRESIIDKYSDDVEYFTS